jgi:hypothetical protein
MHTYKKSPNSASLFILFLLVLASCNNPVFVHQLPGIIGVDNIEILKNNCIEDVGVRGQGYAIETYTLTGEASLAFNNKTSKVLPEKKDWLKYDWITENRDTNYNEIYSVVLNYRGRENINRQIAEIEGLLLKPGVLHAFYYRPDKENPQQVYFFVFDTTNNIFYAIDVSV